ncbi:hypothetical protein D3C84_1140530 [compost metagenome]
MEYDDDLQLVNGFQLRPDEQHLHQQTYDQNGVIPRDERDVDIPGQCHSGENDDGEHTVQRLHGAETNKLP